MARVLGIGGVFFKSCDPAALAGWYERVLGMTPEAWGGFVFPAALAGARDGAFQVIGPMAEDTSYFEPSDQPFLLNLIVDDLDGVLARAAAAGVEAIWRDDADRNGRFAQLIDPDGRKIELWEPKNG